MSQAWKQDARAGGKPPSKPTIHPSKAKRGGAEKGGRKTLLGSLSSEDVNVFENHRLVESPRLIQYERTFVAPPSPLGLEMDDFYDSVVEIPDVVMDKAQEAVTRFCKFLLPRVRRSAVLLGMNIEKFLPMGSMFDGSQVMEAKRADVLMLFTKHKSPILPDVPGYVQLPIKPYVEKEGRPPDPFKYARSGDGTFMSTSTIFHNAHGIIAAILKKSSFAEISPLEFSADRPPLCVTLRDTYVINIIPGFRDSQAPECYIVASPYTWDVDPRAELLWRKLYPDRERELLQRVRVADRCTRDKAFRCMKAFALVEPTLQGLSSYLIKTALLHLCDETVDEVRRWHKFSIDSCFLDLLTKLSHFFSRGKLPHFFEPDFNLLSHVDKRRLYQLTLRLDYLVKWHREVRRVLRKRTESYRRVEPSLSTFDEMLDGEIAASSAVDTSADVTISYLGDKDAGQPSTPMEIYRN